MSLDLNPPHAPPRFQPPDLPPISSFHTKYINTAHTEARIPTFSTNSICVLHTTPFSFPFPPLASTIPPLSYTRLPTHTHFHPHHSPHKHAKRSPSRIHAFPSNFLPRRCTSTTTSNTFAIQYTIQPSPSFQHSQTHSRLPISHTTLAPFHSITLSSSSTIQQPI